MKLVGQFALGGFGIMAVITCVGFGIIAALDGFQSGLVDLEWLLIYCILWGLFGAGAGVVLGLVTLLVKRFRPPSSAPAVPATDETVWPPPITPPSAGRKSGDSAPE